MALGGLTDTQREVNQGGVPFLSSIPILGGLFGHASRQTTETERYLFLTPHVITTDADADSLTAPLKKKAEKLKPQMAEAVPPARPAVCHQPENR